MELNSKNPEIMSVNQSVVLGIIRKNPFLFKEYIILDHEDDEIDFGLKPFWLHINVDELNIKERYKVTSDKQSFENYASYFQKGILIGHLKQHEFGNTQNVTTIHSLSYSNTFKWIFSEFNNDDDYQFAMALEERKIRAHDMFYPDKKIEPGMRLTTSLNPQNKII